MPSADNSQENYEILIAGDADFLSPLDQLFLECRLCPGHCIAATWSRESRNGGHDRSLSSQAHPRWFRDRKSKTEKATRRQGWSHFPLWNHGEVAKADMVVIISLKRPQWTPNHEMNGTLHTPMGVSQMFNDQLSGRKKPWFVVFAVIHGVNTPTMTSFELPTWIHGDCWKFNNGPLAIWE